MQAGRLRHRVSIMTPATSADDWHEASQTFTTLAPAWAEILPLAGQEALEAQKLQSEITHKIRLRFIEGVTPACQVIFGDRTFEVKSALNWGECNKDLMIMAKERL